MELDPLGGSRLIRTGTKPPSTVNGPQFSPNPTQLQENRRVCPSCHAAVLSLFPLPRRYGDSRRVCSACYLESVGRSAMVGWRDDEPDDP
jgi:hypothetical protein